jgi:FKBP-type peptidyl-prolyl cis-trans isomerase
LCHYLPGCARHFYFYYMRFATLSLAALVVGALASCNGSGSKSSKTKEGYAYTLDKHNDDARHVKPGEFITFQVTFRNAKDSLLGPSTMQIVKLDTATAPGQPKDPFLSCYLTLSMGDSARFEIPTDTLFKGASPDQRPSFLPTGTNLKMGISVVRIESAQEEEARVASEIKTAATKGTYKEVENGVFVELVTPGNGKLAVAGDTLTVHYTGFLVDPLVGKKPFDSSVNPPQKGRPADPFKVVLKAGMVIPGWDIGLAYIPEGAKAKILIPHQLGYGERGAQGAIPPFSNLLFEVEVLKIAKGKGAPALPQMPPMPVQ